MIYDYIDEHFSSILKNKPLIFFRDSDFEKAEKYIKTKYPEIKYTIKTEDNTIISCAHFPYTCNEMKEEHSGSYIDGCTCGGFKHNKFCKRKVPLYRSYEQFEWRGELMEHHDNCYDDCCCKSKVFRRFIITIL